MADDLNLLMVRLRELARAHERVSRAAPDPPSAAAAADAALQRVLTLLDEPAIADPLQQLMPAARKRVVDAADDFHDEFEERRAELIEIVATVTRGLGMTKEDIESLYVGYQRAVKDGAEFPEGLEAIKEQLVRVHESTKREVVATRLLSRKDKKRRKRKLGQGVASAIFGTGVIVADTQLPVLFAFSYGLGGAALHQAVRDIVGQSGE